MRVKKISCGESLPTPVATGGNTEIMAETLGFLGCGRRSEVGNRQEQIIGRGRRKGDEMSGLWDEPGIPKRGWSCVDIEDIGGLTGENFEICQMCRAMRIRFVHTMTHPEYHRELLCGCICAGHMEGEAEAANRREQAVKNVAARRRNWLSRRWRMSRNGNSFLNADNRNVVVFMAQGGWGFRVSERWPGGRTVARFGFPTADDARLDAFEAHVALAAAIPEPLGEPSAAAGWQPPWLRPAG
jgi:hypothetical protein